MIDQATFHGGTVAISANYTAPRGTPRVIKCENGGSITLTLPPLMGVRGRMRHLVLATGAGAVVIHDSTGGAVTSLTSGQAARLFETLTGWSVRVTTIGAVRTSNHSTRSAVANLASAVTFGSLSCFEGTDCDLASASGNVPLDGLDGRPLVVAPMFQNAATVPINFAREPIRGADTVMPKVVVLTFASDEFSLDTNHSLAATYGPLSQGFMDALNNSGKPHALTYLGAANGISSHWHHARWEGTGSPAWGYPNQSTFNFRRHVWQELVVYVDGSGTNRTLEVRFVMEHSVDAEPLVTPVGGGGKNDRNVGMWGAHFAIYVFTDEILPAFVDGGTYTPTGTGSPMAFTKANPVKWGPIAGEAATKKFCHPQMVICASLPTTFEAPAGTDYVPWQDRQFLKSFMGDYTTHGKNREYCYLWANGSPWLDVSSCTDPAPGGTVAVRNVVFGWDAAGSLSYAGMTTGGDIPSSKPTEYVVIENGTGVGRTFLKPLRPGWSETCGKLDVATGSSISVSICTSDDQGADDGSGHKVWPGFEVNGCQGHPDEPFEGYGGSHRCFNNNGTSDATPCCIAIAQQVAGAYEQCTDTVTRLGDFTGCGCNIISETCFVRSTKWKQVVLEVEDYDYMMNANQDIRVLSWRRDLLDPSQVFYNTTYASPGTGWVQALGTWTLTSHVTVASTIGPGDLTAIFDYEPSGYTAKYRDSKIVARVTNAMHFPFGLGSNRTDNGFGAHSGYFGVIVPTTPPSGTFAEVYIKKSVLGVITTLAHLHIEDLDNDVVDLEFEKWGTLLTFRYKVSGHTGDFIELTANDCELTDAGWPFLCTAGANAGADFMNIEVTDTSYDYVTVTASISKNSTSVGFPQLCMAGWADCDDVNVPPECGNCASGCEGCSCNCDSHSYQMARQTSATCSGGGSDITMPNCPSTNGDNPTMYGAGIPTCACDGPFCSGGTLSPCVQCPSPFMDLYLNLWQRCLTNDPIDEQSNQPADGEPRLCTGFSHWHYQTIFCA